VKIQIYKDKNGEYRWRMVAKGRILADSGEGYKRKPILRRSLLRLAQRLAEGNYTVEDEGTPSDFP
jgi:hypothetical protein